MDSTERYGFTWPGKAAARALAGTAGDKVLVPLPHKSRNWDTASHLYIEGDNLDALKLLAAEYRGQIALICIDPPYNTGNNRFVYADNFRVDGEAGGPARRHARWCSAMYAALLLARPLLREDGAILINMDENEMVNLQNICAEVFGEENSLGVIVWDKCNPKGDARGISTQHEYIAAWAVDKDAFLSRRIVSRLKKNAARMAAKAAGLFGRIGPDYTLSEANRDYAAWLRAQPELSGGERAYNKIDGQGRVYQSVSMAWPSRRPAPEGYFDPLVHPVTGRPCPVPARGWRNPAATMARLAEEELILFGRDERTQPRRKYYLADNLREALPSVLRYGGSDTERLRRLDIPFETPKVVDIVREHIEAFTRKGEIVLDFYSGSATTAHAVLESNAGTGGDRLFILVQAPEDCRKNRDAARQGFETICDIGLARIRRAADALLAEGKQINPGFRVYGIADRQNAQDGSKEENSGK